MKKDQLNIAIDTLTELASNSETDASIRLQAAQSILSYSHIDPDASASDLAQPASLPSNLPGADSSEAAPAGIQPPSLPGIDANMASGSATTDEPSEPSEPEVKKKKPAAKKKKS